MFGKPEPAPFGQFSFGLAAIKAEVPGHPAIRHAKCVEVVEHAWIGEGWETLDGEDAQVLVAQHWRNAADEGRVAQQAVEKGRCRRRADGRRAGRYRALQIGQRRVVIERMEFGDDCLEQAEGPAAAFFELLQRFPRYLVVDRLAWLFTFSSVAFWRGRLLLLVELEEEARRLATGIRRWRPLQGKMVDGLELR